MRQLSSLHFASFALFVTAAASQFVNGTRCYYIYYISLFSNFFSIFCCFYFIYFFFLQPFYLVCWLPLFSVAFVAILLLHVYIMLYDRQHQGLHFFYCLLCWLTCFSQRFIKLFSLFFSLFCLKSFYLSSSQVIMKFKFFLSCGKLN